jgi:hypothetical protein
LEPFIKVFGVKGVNTAVETAVLTPFTPKTLMSDFKGFAFDGVRGNAPALLA